MGLLGDPMREVTSHHDEDRPDRRHVDASAATHSLITRPVFDAARHTEGLDRRRSASARLHRAYTPGRPMSARRWCCTCSTAAKSERSIAGLAPGCPSPPAGCPANRPPAEGARGSLAWRSISTSSAFYDRPASEHAGRGREVSPTVWWGPPQCHVLLKPPVPGPRASNYQDRMGASVTVRARRGRGRHTVAEPKRGRRRRRLRQTIRVTARRRAVRPRWHGCPGRDQQPGGPVLTSATRSVWRSTASLPRALRFRPGSSRSATAPARWRRRRGIILVENPPPGSPSRHRQQLVARTRREHSASWRKPTRTRAGRSLRRRELRRKVGETVSNMATEAAKRQRRSPARLPRRYHKRRTGSRAPPAAGARTLRTI